MTRIALSIYIDPGAAEVVVNLRKTDGNYTRTTAIVDTGRYRCGNFILPGNFIG